MVILSILQFVTSKITADSQHEIEHIFLYEFFLKIYTVYKEELIIEVIQYSISNQSHCHQFEADRMNTSHLLPHSWRQVVNCFPTR